MQSNSESIELKKLSGELAKLRKSLSLSEEKNFHLEKQLQGKNLEISSLNTQIADLKAVKLNLEKQLIVAKSSFNRGRDDIPRPKSAGPAYRRPASPISKSPSTSYLSPVVNAPHQQINSTNNTLGTKLPLPTQPSTNLPAPKRPVSQSTPKSNSTNKPTTPLTHKPPYQLHKKPPTVTQPQNNDSSKIPPRKTPNKPGNTKVPGQSGIPAPSFVAKKLVAKTPASPQHPPKPTGLNPLSKRPPSTPSHPTSFSTKKPLSASGSSRPTISASNNRNSKRPPSRTSVPPKPSPTKFTVKPPVPVTSPIKSASKPGTPKESQAAEDNQVPLSKPQLQSTPEKEKQSPPGHTDDSQNSTIHQEEEQQQQTPLDSHPQSPSSPTFQQPAASTKTAVPTTNPAYPITANSDPDHDSVSLSDGEEDYSSSGRGNCTPQKGNSNPPATSGHDHDDGQDQEDLLSSSSEEKRPTETMPLSASSSDTE